MNKTVADINKMVDKEPVSSIEATIQGVWDRATGTHAKYGDWSRQFVLLKIGEETVGAQFWGYPDLKNDKGKTYLIESTTGRHGLNGVTASHYEKDGKNVIGLKITDAAKMSPLGGSNYSDKAGPEGHPDEIPQDKGRIIVPEGFDPVQNARDTLAKVKNALYLSTKAVLEVTDALEREGYETTDENFGGMCGQAFKFINVDSLPVDPIWDSSQPLPPQQQFGKDPQTDDDSIPF